MGGNRRLHVDWFVQQPTQGEISMNQVLKLMRGFQTSVLDEMLTVRKSDYSATV